MPMPKGMAFEVLYQHSKRLKKLVDRLMVWDPSLTVSKNAIKMKMNIANATQFKKTWGLSCKKHKYPRSKAEFAQLKKRTKKIKKIQSCRGIGLSYNEISKIMGISRQRIHRLERVGKKLSTREDPFSPIEVKISNR